LPKLGGILLATQRGNYVIGDGVGKNSEKEKSPWPARKLKYRMAIKF